MGKLDWPPPGEPAFVDGSAETELRQESAYIVRYDRIERAVRDRFDLRGSDLALLINGCLEHGRVSQRRRDQLSARGVPPAVFDLVEELAARD